MYQALRKEWPRDIFQCSHWFTEILCGYVKATCVIFSHITYYCDLNMKFHCKLLLYFVKNFIFSKHFL